jgi:hypothetical protein
VDQPRVLRIVLDLLPKAGNEHVDATVERFQTATSYNLQQVISAEHLSGRTDELQEQYELSAGEWDLAAVSIEQSSPGDV